MISRNGVGYIFKQDCLSGFGLGYYQPPFDPCLLAETLSTISADRQVHAISPMSLNFWLGKSGVKYRRVSRAMNQDRGPFYFDHLN
jgi:hypothetical protein